MCFSLFSDSSASYFVSFVCLFWRANQLNSKNFAGVFVSFSSLGHFQYFMTLSHCLGHRCRTLPVRPNETASCAEGKCVAATVAPSSHMFVGNHICCELTFYLLPFFSIEFSTEKVIEVFIFLSFIW